VTFRDDTDMVDVEQEIERLEQEFRRLRYPPLRPVGDGNDRARQLGVVQRHLTRLHDLRERLASFR